MKRIVLGAITAYKKLRFLYVPILRVFLGTDQACRFSPTCAEYTYKAVQKYGSARGLWLGLKRIIRCNPWSRGGYDPVP